MKRTRAHEAGGGGASPSPRVRAEWLRRVEAEYRSAALTQHLVLWLIQIAASPDLVADGLRIVSDELAHSELSFEAHVAAGGSGAPRIPRETLALPRAAGAPLELDVLRACVRNFCLGETVAVPLFKAMRAGCSAEAARPVLDRILRDEVRHRDFGWDLLGWLLDQPGAISLRRSLERELPAMLRDLRASYTPPAAKREQALPDGDRAWGLLPAAEYGRIVERSIERDIAPRLARLGIATAAMAAGDPTES